ncbi:DUF835 domain-containing protein [Thermococcus pacificus]|uniref:DUF835 domain-containing protein n=1 Tax=Thermococcus pacificus TaxID=71998 RepID=A0A218P5H2_9EURY|nr:DUF835 domain-containing protein [Thermococcus pacificus]ASJ06029.1 hypothetical protein A3L08_01115 [Thermococcus pacificus]
MNVILLHTGQTLSFGAKLFAAIYLWYSYRRSFRKSALIFSVAFLTASLQVLGDLIEIETATITMEALFASLLFYGSLKLLDEEGLSFTVSRGYYVSLTPLILTLYMLTAERSSPPNWLATVGVAYVVSGLFILLSGFLLLGLRNLYGNTLKYLGILLIVYGAHEMDYPLLRPVDWFAPFGFSLSAALTLLIAYFFVRFAGQEEFLKLPPERSKPLKEIKPGLTLLSPEEYKKLLPPIKELPLLAFTRNPREAPENWTVYTISQIERERTVSPTNLPKITETVSRYLKTAGNGGIALIDGIEYLNMYNGFEATAKWLSALGDIAYVNNGSVIVVTEREAWNEREWNLLMRLVA